MRARLYLLSVAAYARTPWAGAVAVLTLFLGQFAAGTCWEPRAKVVAASVLAVLCVWALVMARFKPRSSGHVAWMKAQRLRSARTKDAGLDDVLFSTRAKLGLGRFTAMDLLSDFDARVGAERLDEGRTPTAWTSELTRAHNAAAAPMERVLLTGVACGLFQVDDPKALPLRFSLTDEGKKALAEIRDARPIADQGNVISID